MVTRISGFSSGMDVDSMVKEMMKAERVRYDKLKQNKTTVEWKKADYSALYNKIRDFRNNVAFNFKLNSALDPKTAASNNDTIVSATANSDAANMTHDLNVTQLASSAQQTGVVTGTTGYTAVTLKLKNSALSATAKDITIANGDTINDVVSKINNSGAGVRASYDTTLGRLFLYTNQSGASQTIDFSETVDPGAVSFLQNTLGIDSTVVSQGKDAQFSLDGVNNLSQSKNTFTISGVTYNLKNTGVAKLTVNADTEKTVASVKDFVSKYNELLASVNGEIKETKYKDYSPLTDDQRAAMSETQVTQWEEKAKSGMLYHDSILQGAVSTMRMDISRSISGLTGSYTNLSSIGITTGYDYSEGGKLYLDEDKLRSALEKDPDALKNLFARDGATASEDGVAVRLYDSLSGILDKIKAKAGTSAAVMGGETSSLAKQIKDYDKKISDMNDRLLKLEDRYYNQFTAMETAISKYNSQSSWLSQQLSSSSQG